MDAIPLAALSATIKTLNNMAVVGQVEYLLGHGFWKTMLRIHSYGSGRASRARPVHMAGPYTVG